MDCTEFNADVIPAEGAIDPEIIRQIKEMKKCGHCLQCLYSYIMLAPQLSNKELTELFGADLLEMAELAPVLDELAGFTLNPYPNRLRIARVNKCLQKISLQKERGGKALVKHYINECIRQYEGDMLEEYYNMAP